MPNAENNGFVDYVLWDDDSKPPMLVEAKCAWAGDAAGQRGIPDGVDLAADLAGMHVRGLDTEIEFRC